MLLPLYRLHSLTGFNFFWKKCSDYEYILDEFNIQDFCVNVYWAYIALGKYCIQGNFHHEHKHFVPLVKLVSFPVPYYNILTVHEFESSAHLLYIYVLVVQAVPPVTLAVSGTTIPTPVVAQAVPRLG